MRVIITYDEEFGDYKLLASKLDKYLLLCPEVVVMTNSRAIPGKHLGERWAFANWYAVERYRGKDQIETMVRAADEVVAFTDGSDRNVREILKKAKSYNLKIKRIEI